MESARWKLEDKAVVSDIENAVKSHVCENEKVIRRSNRIVYSLYTIPSESGEPYKYIGFIGRFISID